MTGSTPHISVVVPCYNGMRTLDACLGALSRLAPESPAHEIIVVDNGSTDGSLAAIGRYSCVRLVKEHEIRGPAAARNAGAREACGEILAFTDIDCIATPEWLQQGIQPFGNPSVVGVGGAIDGAPPKNAIQEWMNQRRVLDQERALQHTFMPFLQTANAFFRRDAFLAVGGFDVGLRCGEDCDLSWRIQRETGGRLEYCPEALVYHDHRCSIRGLYRQSMTNATAGARLALKWQGAVAAKNWKTSVWECGDILRAAGRYVSAVAFLKDRRTRFERRLDLLHRVARKHGMIRSAWQTRQWSQW